MRVIPYIWWLVQWSVSAGNESKESGVALRDLVPVLDVSTSRKTSRMSGLREWRDLVRPRTVRLRALTRCFTASACERGKPAMLDFSSFVDNSRPCKTMFTLNSEPVFLFPLVFMCDHGRPRGNFMVSKIIENIPLQKPLLIVESQRLPAILLPVHHLCARKRITNVN